MARMCSHGLERSSRFPVGLLSAGYATGAVAAFVASMSGIGPLAAVMIFWIGSAIATLGIGALLVYGLGGASLSARRAAG